MAEHGIEYYETPPSFFMISAGGIWVRNDEDFPQAKKLFDAYQARRAERARAEYGRRRAEGRAPTWLDLFMANPARISLYTVLAAGILFVMFTLVVQLGR